MLEEREGVPVSKWIMTEGEQAEAAKHFAWTKRYAYLLSFGRYGSLLPVEDIISLCHEGMCQAIMTFDPEKGGEIHCFIRNNMRWNINRYLQKKQKSVQADLYPELEPLCVDYKVEANELLARAESELSDVEKMIFRMKYIEGYTFVEIGKKLSISKQRVEQRSKQIIRKLKGNEDVHCCVR